MKMIGAFLLFIVTTGAYSSSYEIARFEASDYRTFSTEELKTLVGDNYSELSHHVCNGRDEFDPFFSPHRMNPLLNSLSIKDQMSGEVIVYQQGHFFLNNREVTAFSDSFVKSVAKALLKLEQVPHAAKLLRLLESSYFPLEITTGRNSFNPISTIGKNYSGIKMAQAIAYFASKRMSPGGDFFDIGAGGKIHWNPKIKVSTIEADGIKRPLDPDVALAHEMFHALDSIRGTLDMGFVSGKDYAFEGVLEYRAVYFENLVRKDLGILYRKFYGEPSSLSDPDVLDENNEPIYIPTTCLASDGKNF